MDTIKVICQNHENWLRLVVLIDYAGSKLCQEVLHTKEGLLEDGSLLYHELLPYKDKMQFNNQKEILCPQSGVTDESKFDITLYTRPIEKMFVGRHNLLIKDLRKTRNDLHHLANKDISDSDFEKRWKSACDMLQRHGFTEAVDDLKTGSLLTIEKLEKILKSIENLIKGSV